MNSINLSLEMIPDWKRFQGLVVEYFKYLETDKQNNIQLVEAKDTGIGPDGGVDVFVNMNLYDGILNFKRKWIIQCKFEKTNINKKILSNVNIPTLIHEHSANGYLLICKKDVTSDLSRTFANLNENCKFGYKYQIWSGSQFEDLLRKVNNSNILPNFFPEYNNFISQEANKIKGNL